MSPTEEGTDAPDGPTARWARVATVLVTAVLVPVVMVALVATQSPEFSVLDEPVHSDYLRRIEQGEVPRVGDKLLEASVRDVQCRTVQGRVNAPCGLPRYEPEIMGADGYQYEAQQPPVYYAVTAVLRQVVRVGPADDFVTTARLTGAAWLSAGLLVFWAGCRRLGCRWWPTATLALLLAIGPGVVYQSATINNDAAAILTGSTALLMVASLRERPHGWAVAGWCAAAVALVLVKPTGVVAIGAGCAAVLLDAAIDRRLTWRRALAVSLPVLVGLVAYVGWSEVREARATVDYDIVLEALLSFKMTEDFPLDDVSANITRLVGAYGSGGVPISPPFVASPAGLVMTAVMAAGFVSLWAPRGGEAAQRAGSVALVTLLVGGPAFTLLFYLDYSVEGGPAARYGLSLLPLLAAGAAATYRTRRAMAALLGLGVLLLVPLMIAIGYPTTRV
jgi:hypothetical protein